jgi:leucyl-tRNA synthetase
MGFLIKFLMLLAEKKWQKKWAESNIFHTDLKNIERKCYALVMFIYPSSDRLQTGHWFN